jgi:hypothetical protein
MSRRRRRTTTDLSIAFDKSQYVEMEEEKFSFQKMLERHYRKLKIEKYFHL